MNTSNNEHIPQKRVNVIHIGKRTAIRPLTLIYPTAYMDAAPSPSRGRPVLPLSASLPVLVSSRSLHDLFEMERLIPFVLLQFPSFFLSNLFPFSCRSEQWILNSRRRPHRIFSVRVRLPGRDGSASQNVIEPAVAIKEKVSGSHEAEPPDESPVFGQQQGHGISLLQISAVLQKSK